MALQSYLSIFLGEQKINRRRLPSLLASITYALNPKPTLVNPFPPNI